MSIKKNGIYWKGIKRRIGKFFEKVHECILIFTESLIGTEESAPRP